MLENHKLVKVVEVETESMSVDTYKVLERIRKIAKLAHSTTGAISCRLCTMHKSLDCVLFLEV